MRLMKLERENGEETYEKKENCSGIWLTVSIYSTMQCFVRLGPTIFGGKIGERREKLLKDLYRTNGQLAIRETQSKRREERGINRGEREEKEDGRRIKKKRGMKTRRRRGTGSYISDLYLFSGDSFQGELSISRFAFDLLSPYMPTSFFKRWKMRTIATYCHLRPTVQSNAPYSTFYPTCFPSLIFRIKRRFVSLYQCDCSFFFLN